jgi:hypothetical protein
MLCRACLVDSRAYCRAGDDAGTGPPTRGIERTLSCSDPSPRVGRNHGKAGSHRALRAHVVVVVVGVDVLFFRDHFWERLMANVGIVLVFGAFYFRFLKHS